MTNTTITDQVNTIFDKLEHETKSIISESSDLKDAVKVITKKVSSDLATKSKLILSDMLFDLYDNTLDTDDFFSDASKQNRFFEINLREEILSKYQFTPSTTINYKEASRTVQALKIGGTTFVVGGAAEIGVALAAGLSVSSLVPIPISILIVATLGAALADYCALEPARAKNELIKASDAYLKEAKRQFLKWFDDIEKYFNRRVEEIKKSIEAEI